MESAAISKALYAVLKSPFAVKIIWSKAWSSTFKLRCFKPLSCVILFVNPSLISSSESFLSSNTLHLETIAGVIDTYGFSVVEPIKIISPLSIAGSKLSLCALLNLWHSSSKRYVLLPYILKVFLPSSITFLTSATPEVTAFNLTKLPFVALEIMFASVDLPHPGGPQKMQLPNLSARIARNNKESLSTKCFCPRNSVKSSALILSASGLFISFCVLKSNKSILLPKLFLNFYIRIHCITTPFLFQHKKVLHFETFVWYNVCDLR